MKKFLFLLLFPIIAQAQSWTTVYGTIYDGLGRVYAKQPVLVVKTLKNGAPLISSIPQTVLTDANGYVSWKSPRTAPGDTVVIYVYAQVPAYSKFGGAGVPLIIPNAETAELSTLVTPVTVPNSYPILVSGGFVSGAVLSDSLDANPRVPDVSGIISDSLDANPRIPDVSGLISDSLDSNPRVPDTTGTTNQPAFSLFENMLGQFTVGTSDSLLQAQSDAKLALNIGQGKADADSVKLAFDRLGDRADADSLASVKITADAALPKADTTFLHSQKFKNIEDKFGDRADADSLASVKITADGAFQSADTNALHAQKLKNLTDSVSKANDSIRVLGPLLTTTKNDLTGHIGTADAHLPSQTGQAGKVLGTNGTVSAWQPEADPIYSAAAPTLRSKGDTLVDVRQTHLEMPNLTHILTADSNKTICVDGSGRLYLCWKGSGGAAVDTSRLLPSFGTAKTATGTLAITATAADTALAVRSGGNTIIATGEDVNYRTIRLGLGTNISERVSTGNLVLQPRGNGAVWLRTPSQVVIANGFAVLDSQLIVGHPTLKGGVRVYGGAYFSGGLGLGRAPTNDVKLDVVGRSLFSDTLRVGDYTTYSWIKPGDAAWTASSTIDVKRDIAPIDTVSATDTRGILARVASVDPVRYRFRPQVFRVPFDTSYANGTWFTLKLAQRQAMREEYRLMDSLRAEEKAAGYLTGFLAEQFNAAFGDPNSKEISYSDVVAVEWRAIQALIRRTRLQEQRIDALEETIRQMDARLKAGGL